MKIMTRDNAPVTHRTKRTRLVTDRNSVNATITMIIPRLQYEEIEKRAKAARMNLADYFRGMIDRDLACDGWAQR